ncbi:hypothetical protein E8L99_02725 [Phreatobacter aquaticus]|uniref:Uncharacterized protein n=1 Tax=Phreatobacter aquaticus TaxID=2570229 RepID=A0A4D7Q9F9_9HYPH|nr:hypothetical protein [Phreatobacter aquaticus]QCK84770.1 hypothetical protein E8L99_02725 [Phreatobacter aquaticus]
MQRTILRSFALVWGALGLGLAGLSMASLSMVGFPDGHVTAYEAETLGLRRVLTGLCVVQALVIPWMMLGRRRVSTLGVLIALTAAALLIIAPLLIVPSCPGSETCRRCYEGVFGRPMNHGVGG